jgi:hypothetical protein
MASRHVPRRERPHHRHLIVTFFIHEVRRCGTCATPQGRAPYAYRTACAQLPGDDPADGSGQRRFLHWGQMLALFGAGPEAARLETITQTI